MQRDGKEVQPNDLKQFVIYSVFRRNGEVLYTALQSESKTTRPGRKHVGVARIVPGGARKPGLMLACF